MLPVSTKLSLLVLGLPISILAILDTAIYFVNGSLVLEASNFLSSILVFLLVWERLRDSLYKKMERIHEDYLFDLYNNLKLYDDTYINSFFQSSDNIKKLRIDLGKYASFLNIKLYPSRLLQKMDEFLTVHDALNKKVQQFVKMGTEKLGRQCDKWNLLDCLGIEVTAVQFPQEQEKNEYKRIAQAIQNEHQDLVDETKRILDSLKNLKNLIRQELEGFLKCNSLKTEQKYGQIS